MLHSLKIKWRERMVTGVALAVVLSCALPLIWPRPVRSACGAGCFKTQCFKKTAGDYWILVSNESASAIFIENPGNGLICDGFRNMSSVRSNNGASNCNAAGSTWALASGCHADGTNQVGATFCDTGCYAPQFKPAPGPLVRSLSE
jgi:hypothetical protein